MLLSCQRAEAVGRHRHRAEPPTAASPASSPPAADLIRAGIMEERAVKGPEARELSGCEDIDSLLGNSLPNERPRPLLL